MAGVILVTVSKPTVPLRLSARQTWRPKMANELSIEQLELETVSGGGGISIGVSSFLQSIMTKQPTSNPTPTGPTSTTPKSASFDPVTVRF